MIVTTKLHVPTPPHRIVSRPRLTRMLDEGAGAKLILVSAQAGYGKTTAIGEWIARQGATVAWVSLDPSDNDWATFWRYIVASIGRHVPDFGASCMPLLEAGASAPPELAVAALIQELSGLDRELLLVLDDYHHIELPSIHDSMSYAVEHLPPAVRICIASRTELPFPAARLTATGALRRVDMEDLKFRPDEGVAFFREATELSLTRAQATRLVRQTEGWISGLQLAAISLGRSEDVAASVRRLDGPHPLVFDYLMEEVFARLPESLRDFLLETSVLSRMNRSLCEAVTGRQDGQRQLERLERLNLFIVRLDEQRHWYRYHHLLSRFLNRLFEEEAPERFKQAHARAAEWFERHGFPEEAVEHYLEGKRHAEAVRVIERHLPFLMQANLSALGKWVAVLPEDALADRPALTLFSISALVVSGQWDAAYRRAEQAGSRFEALRDRLPPEDWRRAMGNLHFFRGVAAFLHQDLERTSRCFEQAERYMPEGSSYQMMGRNRYPGHDSHHDLLAVLRDLREAEPFFLRWIQAWKAKKEFPFVGYMYAAYCSLLYEWNRLDDAERLAGEALEREDLMPYARLKAHIAITASHIQLAKGREREARDYLSLLESWIVTPDYPLFVRKIEAERAALSLRLGQRGTVREWMNAGEPSSEDETSTERMAGHLLLARALAEDGRYDEALGLLERLSRFAATGGRLRDRIRVAIAHSAALMRSGRKEAALRKLEQALRKAEPQGYVRSFVDEGPPIAAMLAELGKADRGPAQPEIRAYARMLLQAFEHEPREASLPSLTAQETKVLALMAEGLANKEIADRMALHIETVKFHIKNAYRKLGANNRVQAVQQARQRNFLP